MFKNAKVQIIGFEYTQSYIFFNMGNFILKCQYKKSLSGIDYYVVVYQ